MYYLVYGFLYLLSLVPFRVIYLISDVITFFIRDVFKYRKELVLKNLRLSFPEKTEEEIARIAKNFYRNFTDNWMETIKLLSITRKELDKRYQTDYSVCEKAYAEGRTLVMMCGHFFNWEFANVHISYHQSFPFLGVYMPLTSKTFDRLFKTIRARFGTILMKATEMKTEMIPWRDKQYAIGLIADQSPGRPQSSYWLNFLNRPAAVTKGPERTAINMNAVVIMAKFSKWKRGHYKVHFDYLNQEPQLASQGEITRMFMKKLEENIHESPDLYLWSHNRWKISWKPEFESLWIDRGPAPAHS